jgi:hypothetical protein
MGLREALGDLIRCPSVAAAPRRIARPDWVKGCRFATKPDVSSARFSWPWRPPMAWIRSPWFGACSGRDCFLGWLLTYGRRSPGIAVGRAPGSGVHVGVAGVRVGADCSW